jgi:transcriptional regulator with XRE-family HTH domain
MTVPALFAITINPGKSISICAESEVYMKPNTISENFAERLTTIRKSKNLSQSDVATRAGLQVAVISFFETARRKPSFDNLLKLADALSVSTDYLLGRQVARVSSTTGKLLRDFEKLSIKDQAVIVDMT